MSFYRLGTRQMTGLCYLISVSPLALFVNALFDAFTVAPPISAIPYVAELDIVQFVIVGKPLVW